MPLDKETKLNQKKKKKSCTIRTDFSQFVAAKFNPNFAFIQLYRFILTKNKNFTLHYVLKPKIHAVFRANHTDMCTEKCNKTMAKISLH